jgi:hypothetical protein
MFIISEYICKCKRKNLRDSYQKFVQRKEGHSGDRGTKLPTPWKYEKVWNSYEVSCLPWHRHAVFQGLRDL